MPMGKLQVSDVYRGMWGREINIEENLGLIQEAANLAVKSRRLSVTFQLEGREIAVDVVNNNNVYVWDMTDCKPTGRD